MTPNPFDQAVRYLAKLDPGGFLLWLRCQPLWKQELEGWNAEQSLQVME